MKRVTKTVEKINKTGFLSLTVIAALFTITKSWQRRPTSTSRRVVVRKLKFSEAESSLKIVFRRLWEGGNEEVLLNGYRISA